MVSIEDYEDFLKKYFVRFRDYEIVNRIENGEIIDVGYDNMLEKCMLCNDTSNFLVSSMTQQFKYEEFTPVYLEGILQIRKQLFSNCGRRKLIEFKCFNCVETTRIVILSLAIDYNVIIQSCNLLAIRSKLMTDDNLIKNLLRYVLGETMSLTDKCNLTEDSNYNAGTKTMLFQDTYVSVTEIINNILDRKICGKIKSDSTVIIRSYMLTDSPLFLTNLTPYDDILSTTRASIIDNGRLFSNNIFVDSKCVTYREYLLDLHMKSIFFE